MLKARALGCSVVSCGLALTLCAGAAVGQVTVNVVNVNAQVSTTGISGDGQVLFGSTFYAFRWSQGPGIDFPPLGAVNAANADGSILVGPVFLPPFNRSRAARWSALSGIQQIPLLVASDSIASSSATGVSGDGAVVVGLEFSNSRKRLFRWSAAGGNQELIPPQFGSSEEGGGVSDDGQVVVGRYIPRTANGAAQFGVGGAFRWTQAGGMQNLGVLPGFDFSRAIATNADGSVIVGQCLTVNLGSDAPPDSFRAFRWTASGGMQSLGVLDEYEVLGSNGPTIVSNSRAIDVSADGNTVLISVSRVGGGTELYRWVNGQGARPVRELVAESGVSILPYTLLGAASGGLSNDGMVISATCFGPVPSGGQNFQACLISGLALPIPSTCSPSDVAGVNQAIGPNGMLTADDIIVFLGWFLAGDQRANVAGAEQSTTPDSRLTADDVIVFLGRYFAGC